MGKNLIKKDKIKNICLAGGVSMNVKANMLISKIEKKINLMFLHVPDDASQAMGACFANLINKKSKNLHNSYIKNVYLGPKSEKLSDSKIKSLNNNKYKIIRKNFLKSAAKLLSQNKIIARYAGKAEFGARALGNRSILANPQNLEIKNKINKKNQKQRFLRCPLQLQFLRNMQKYFHLDNETESYKYMTICVETTNLGKIKLPAAIHPYDKTCRPHIIQRNDNKDYEKLILELGKIWYLCSFKYFFFNLHGYPIINNLNSAINILKKSNLGGLLLDDCLIVKK